MIDCMRCNSQYPIIEYWDIQSVSISSFNVWNFFSRRNMLHTSAQLIIIIIGRGSNNYSDYGLVMMILYIDCHYNDGLAVMIPLEHRFFFLTTFFVCYCKIENVKFSSHFSFCWGFFFFFLPVHAFSTLDNKIIIHLFFHCTFSQWALLPNQSAIVLDCCNNEGSFSIQDRDETIIIIMIWLHTYRCDNRPLPLLPDQFKMDGDKMQCFFFYTHGRFWIVIL